RIGQIAQELGEATACDEAVLRELLPELLSGKGRLISFGRGLARAAPVPEELWDLLVAQLALTPENNRNTQVLGGYLAELNMRDPGLAGTLLDRAVEHDVLGRWLPVLQTFVPLDANGIARLTRALAADRAPIHSYRYLAYGPFTDPIPGSRLRPLLAVIA